MNNFIKGVFGVTIAFVLCATFVNYARASSLSVEPLFLEVNPGQSAAIRVKNPSDQAITVEVFVQERHVDENGVQTRIDADDDFIIFPPQAVLKASSIQVFRLQPLGVGYGKSKSYYVTIKQVPVNLEPLKGGGARIQVVFAFDSAVHVNPRGAKAKPEFLSVKTDRTTIKIPTGKFKMVEDGEQIEIIEEKDVPAIAVTFENTGNKYLYVQNYKYTVTGTGTDGKKVSFPNWTVQEILNAVRVVLVEPGAKRTIKLPLPEGVAATDLKVQIKKRASY